MKKYILVLIILFSFLFLKSTFSQEGDITGGSIYEEEENLVGFNISKINYEVDCSTNIVNIFDINIETQEVVETVEYSLDGGLNWLLVDGLEFNILEKEFDKEIFVLKLRVKTDVDEFVSVDKYISNNCVNDMFFGYFFESGGEIAINNGNGDILLDPNKSLRVFVESSLGVSEVRVGCEDDFVNLNYDFSTKLWSGEIPKRFLEKEENNLNVFSDSVVRKLPAILNVEYFDIQFSDYEIFYFNGYRWELMDYGFDELKYPVFDLLPGKYFVKLKEDLGWFYSPIFEIEQRSLVSFESSSGSFPRFLSWLETYFVSLDFKIFDSNYLFKESYLHKEEYFPLDEYITDDSFFMYINSWNPIYKRYLSSLEILVEEYDIILFTDDLNYNLLESSFKKYDEDIKIYRVGGEELEFLLEFQPELFFYDYDLGGVFSVRDLSFLNNLIN